MKRLHLGRYALSASATVVMLAACGGSQLPIGEPGTTAQNITWDEAQPSSRTMGPALSRFETLYAFTGGQSGPGGALPLAGLTELHGALYGTTYAGGAYGWGTAFRITSGGAEATLHSFSAHMDGVYPMASLIVVGGALYGTTQGGGTAGAGTVFRLSSKGTETVLSSFQGSPDGGSPQAALVDFKGVLYGTTFYGGTGSCRGSLGCGTVFAMYPSGERKTIYSFHGEPDGAFPFAALTGVGNVLYGTTYSGGANNLGTVFTITQSGVEHVLFSFKGKPNDGAAPMANLTNLHGRLYGTTETGGEYDYGTVYRVETSGADTVLFSFTPGATGILPHAGLTNKNGTLYGSAFSQDLYSRFYCCGVVFKVTQSGEEAVIHTFTYGESTGYSSGVGPNGNLLNYKGSLYGTTANGGGTQYCETYGCGTVFKVSP